MKEDPEFAERFKDELFVVRQDKEFDINRIQAIHDRIDYFKDADKMDGKIKSDTYDLKDEPYATEDDVLSTELSDPGDADIYRKYKLILYNEAETREKLEAKETELHETMKNQLKGKRNYKDEHWMA
jgi:hypothetical protein